MPVSTLAISGRKVCHLSSVHPARDVRILEKECATLAGAGFDGVLIARHPRSERLNGVRIVGIAAPRNRLERMVVTAWRVFRLALKEHADIFHIHDPELLPWAQLLRLTGRPVIYDMHEHVPRQIVSKHWIPARLRGAARWLFKSAERLLMAGLPVIFAELSYARDYAWVRQHETVLNMPLIDQITRIEAQSFTTATVGYLGVVSPIRGSAITLEALRILKEQGLKVGWECIGPVHPADHLAELRQRVAEAGLPGIHLRGYLPPAESWEIMARCHAGLAVLQPEPNYLESYPTKLFEYMAMGIPVIVSDFPLYAQVVETAACGLCVDPRDPLQIAQAIRQLIEHPGQAAAMGRRGRQAALSRYRWDVEGEKLVRFYRQVLGQ